ASAAAVVLSAVVVAGPWTGTLPGVARPVPFTDWGPARCCQGGAAQGPPGAPEAPGRGHGGVGGRAGSARPRPPARRSAGARAGGRGGGGRDATEPAAR